MVTDEMLRQCERFLRLVNDRIEADGKIGRGARLITSQIDTAPKQYRPTAQLPQSLITSQIDTAPKPTRPPLPPIAV